MLNWEKYKFSDLKKSHYFKIVVTLLVISVFIIIGFAIYFSNIRDRGELARSRQELYKVTDSDRASIVFEYSSKNNILSDMKIRDKYYIFDALDANGKKYDDEYLVDKKDLRVYIFDSHGLIIPYEDYVDNETPLGSYFAALKKLPYADIPGATKNYIEKKGGLTFLNKVSKIMDNVDLEAVDKSGGIVTYVDYIINGVSQKKLNKEDFWKNE